MTIMGITKKIKAIIYLMTDEDIRAMVEVITQPEEILYGIDKKRGTKMFFFFKKGSDGTYNLAEVYADRSGNLTAKSFYKTKKDSSQRVMDIRNSLLPTSVTYSGASLSSDAKIPQLFEIRNSDAVKTAESSKPQTMEFSIRQGGGEVRDGLATHQQERAVPATRNYPLATLMRSLGTFTGVACDVNGDGNITAVNITTTYDMILD